MNVLASELAGRPVIVGGGVAGLWTALRLAPRPVVVLVKSPLGFDASSPWAQGGLAAALGQDDAADLHAADTVAAGAGLTEPEVALRFAEAAPGAIHRLAEAGARFDRDGSGAFRLGLEAAHSRHRIVHAAGDGSGREVMRALIAAVRAAPHVTVIEGAEVRRLIVEDGRIAGLSAVVEGRAVTLATGQVVLATGGVGGLFEDTTNPLGAFGQGLALAARAGGVIADPEFVQFHPTALDIAARPLPLVSEAVRGEGAILVDDLGERFMADVPGQELAPRDVVARAIWRRRWEGRRVFLDARRLGRGFAARFPAIDGLCRAAGVDPASQPIPVRPAAHYHMGGVAVDGRGRTSVEGLWACGEVASTGLHGANRLASNSLSEALVWAEWIAEDILDAEAVGEAVETRLAGPRPDPAVVRPLVSAALGVERDGVGLQAFIASAAPLAAASGPSADPALVALFMGLGALRRQESRGSHLRADYPDLAAPSRTFLTLDAVLAAARDLEPQRMSA